MAAVTVALLVGIGYFHVTLIQAIPGVIDVDPLRTYLPGALALLAQGMDFFSTPTSYRTAPLNFVWPALFGADPEAIMAANITLSAVNLVLIFLGARAIGGWLAGVTICTAINPANQK